MIKFGTTTATLLAMAMAFPAIANAQAAATAPAATAAKAKKAMTYDCTKAGNKNKAACKTAAMPAAAAPAKKSMFGGMMGAKPAAANAAPAAAAPAKKPMFGGMMGSKTAAAKASNPNEVAYTTKTGKVIHYDCSKAGNKNKTACKGH